MFESIQGAPADPIFGLTKLFREDPNPDKINLAVGIYQDAAGKTPALTCVRTAVGRIANRIIDRQYLPIDGIAEYDRLVVELLLGAEHSAIAEHRTATVQTLGGTSALKVAGDTIFQLFGPKTIWVSDPTWGNHHQIFKNAGHQIAKYPWLNEARTGLDFEKVLPALDAIPDGDIVLFHGCCHNPSGVDPTTPQWQEILEVIQRRNLLPIFDVAYQGFAESVDEDAAILRQICEGETEVIICNSFSKNFSLYNERVGGLTVVMADRQSAQNVLSHVKTAIRSNYSNPPHHGAAIVAEVLGNQELSEQWLAELSEMQCRIIAMRKLFSEKMSHLSPESDFSFVTMQRGMFSYTGLDEQQVARLREESSIYLLRSGRINLAGLSEENIDKVCEAVADVATSKV